MLVKTWSFIISVVFLQHLALEGKKEKSTCYSPLCHLLSWGAHMNDWTDNSECLMCHEEIREVCYQQSWADLQWVQQRVPVKLCPASWPRSNGMWHTMAITMFVLAKWRPCKLLQESVRHCEYTDFSKDLLECHKSSDLGKLEEVMVKEN